jgi:hypothetical protein
MTRAPAALPIGMVTRYKGRFRAEQCYPFTREIGRDYPDRPSAMAALEAAVRG